MLPGILSGLAGITGKEQAIVKAINTTSVSSASPITVNLPSGLVLNDLLIAFVTRGTATQTFTFPSGFSPLYNVSQNTVGFKASCYYKFLTAGSAEIGASTMSVSSTVTPSQATRVVTYRVANAVGIAASNSSTNDADMYAYPPNFSPSWGADSNLWIATYHGSLTYGGVTSWPDYYDDNQRSLTGLGVCTRTYNVAAEDPGEFRVNHDSANFAFTVAVH